MSGDSIEMGKYPEDQVPSIHNHKDENQDADRSRTIIADETADNTEYPPMSKVLAVTAAIAVTIFLVAMDQTIIATAIPYITNEFQSLGDVGWYASAYLFASCLFQLLWGKVFQYFLLQKVFLLALAIFEIGSILCAAAPTSPVLILGRAISGLGSAGVTAGYGIVISRLVPLHKRAMYDSYLGAVFSMAAVVAPLIGGALTSRASWRWCFWINLPCGFVAGAAIWAFVDLDQGHKEHQLPWKEKLANFDMVGSLTLMGSLACLLLSLQWGGIQYAWSDGIITALFVVSGVLFCAFLVMQWRFANKSLVPPRLLRQRSVYCSLVYILLGGAATTIAEYYLPIWFQGVKGASPLSSGIMILQFILSHLVLSIFSGTLITMIGLIQPFLLAGAVVLTVGLGVFTISTPETKTGYSVLFQLLIGAGAGLGVQAAMLPAQTLLPNKDIAIGLSILNFGFVLGGAISVAIAQTVFDNRLLTEVASLNLNINSTDLTATGITDIYKLVPASKKEVAVSAYNDAAISPFYVAAAVSAVSFVAAIGIKPSLTVKKKST